MLQALLLIPAILQEKDTHSQATAFKSNALNMLFAGLWPHRGVWLYGGLAMGTFMVRSITHVIFRDAAHSRKFYATIGSKHILLLLSPAQNLLEWIFADKLSGAA